MYLNNDFFKFNKLITNWHLDNSLNNNSIIKTLSIAL
jgi:hypothetical protein